MLDDRREPTLRLFKAPATEPPQQRRRRERRPRDETGEQLRLDAALLEALAPPDDVPQEPAAIDDVPAPDTAAATVVGDPPSSPKPTPEPDDAPPAPDAETAWVPVFNPADDLNGLLKARGRLLSRAFNGAPTDT
jgi:hypothetical protein